MKFYAKVACYDFLVLFHPLHSFHFIMILGAPGEDGIGYAKGPPGSKGERGLPGVEGDEGLPGERGDDAPPGTVVYRVPLSVP